MVALKTERRVYMWHVEPRPVPRDAPVTVTLVEIAALLKASYAAKTAEIYLGEEGRPLPDDVDPKLKDPKNRVYIADYSEDHQFVTCLINRGDPYVADTAFINANTGAVKPVPPGQNESQGWSAHLVIAKGSKGGVHRACFERMPHASSSFAETLFRTIIERATAGDLKYTYKVNVKKGRKIIEETKHYRPHLAIKKVPSEQIKKDIAKGELSSIILIDSKSDYAGPDAPDIIKSVEQKLIIKPHKVDQKRVLGYIEKLAPWARKQGYNEIQIKVTDLPGGATASPRFELEKGDATETLYVRTQRLTGFGTFLQRCYGTIEPEIKKKMTDLINDQEKW